MTYSKRLIRYNYEGNTLKQKKAQVSLEFLIVLVAFFSLLLIFTPIIARIHNIGVLALEKKKAQAFAEEFSQTLDEFSLLSDGSKKQLQIKTLIPWKIEITEKELLIELQANSEEKEASTVSKKFSQKINPSSTYCEMECVFVIEKIFSKIQVKAQVNH